MACKKSCGFKKYRNKWIIIILTSARIHVILNCEWLKESFINPNPYQLVSCAYIVKTFLIFYPLKLMFVIMITTIKLIFRFLGFNFLYSLYVLFWTIYHIRSEMVKLIKFKHSHEKRNNTELVFFLWDTKYFKIWYDVLCKKQHVHMSNTYVYVCMYPLHI